MFVMKVCLLYRTLSLPQAIAIRASHALKGIAFIMSAVLGTVSAVVASNICGRAYST